MITSSYSLRGDRRPEPLQTGNSYQSSYCTMRVHSFISYTASLNDGDRSKLDWELIWQIHQTMKRPCHHIPNLHNISAFFTEPQAFFKEPRGHRVKVSPTETNLCRILCWMCVGISHSAKTPIHAQTKTITYHWRNTLQPFFASQNSSWKT